MIKTSHRLSWKRVVMSLVVFASAAQTPAATSGQDGRKTVWGGVYTEAQAVRGKKAFEVTCGRCHADDLSGGVEPPPLAGSVFTAHWNNTPLAELYDKIASTMPKSQTGGFSPGTLPLETCIDIVSYLLKFNGMPAGQMELTTDIETLEQIRFTATPPAR